MACIKHHSNKSYGAKFNFEYLWIGVTNQKTVFCENFCLIFRIKLHTWFQAHKIILIILSYFAPKWSPIKIYVAVITHQYYTGPQKSFVAIHFSMAAPQFSLHTHRDQATYTRFGFWLVCERTQRAQRGTYENEIQTYTRRQRSCSNIVFTANRDVQSYGFYMHAAPQPVVQPYILVHFVRLYILPIHCVWQRLFNIRCSLGIATFV